MKYQQVEKQHNDYSDAKCLNVSKLFFVYILFYDFFLKSCLVKVQINQKLRNMCFYSGDSVFSVRHCPDTVYFF